MTTHTDTSTYADVRSALEDARTARGASNDPQRWPEWVKLLLATGAVIVSVTLAYASLDKRLALQEQKLDFIIQQMQVKRP